MYFNIRHIWRKCRELSSYYLFLSNHFFYFPTLGILTLFTLPALLYGCSSVLDSEEQTSTSEITITHNSMNSVTASTLDILIFNNDELKRLDSYQRFDNWDSGKVQIASRCGEKIVFAVANSRTQRFSWAQINSIDAVSEMTVTLKDDSLEKPIMTGCILTSAGNQSIGKTLEIIPFSSIIEIKSIRADFSGLPYEGETITDAKAYLININSECSLTASNNIMPAGIINMGEFCESDLEDFQNSRLFLHRFTKDIDSNWLKDPVKLICYPNTTHEESPGSPFTKLVVEGKICGNTYYWTIPINRTRDSNKQGIYRNCKYIYNIDIRRKGTTKPNINANTEEIKFKMEIEKWDDKEDYEITW